MSVKDTAVKAAPVGYDLNGSDRSKIATYIEECLGDDQFIFPFCNGVSDFLSRYLQCLSN